MSRFAPTWLILGWALAHASLAQRVDLPIDPSPGDAFGFAMAFDEPYLFVGAPGRGDPGGADGTVLIFSRTAQEWRHFATLHAPLTDAVESFGVNVAASESVVAVAARDRHLDASGIVYVFEWDSGGSLRMRATLRMDRPAVADGFGLSLAVSGTTLLVGAPGTAGGSAKEGAVYVYERLPDGAWRPSSVLTSGDPGPFGVFGSSVAFDGEVAIVGARGESDGSGAAYVFERSERTWSTPVQLSPDSTSDGSFGRSVALRGNTILVGAPHPRSATGTGTVYVFRRRGDRWHVSARLEASESERDAFFGHTVALNETMLVVGAPGDDGLGKDTGALFLFRAEDVPRETGLFRMPSGAGRDAFGSAPILTGTVLLSSAPGSSNGAGALGEFDVSAPALATALSFRRVAHPDDGLMHGHVETVHQDAKRRLWIGTFAGLSRYDGREYVDYEHVPGDSSSLFPGAVLSVHEDRSGRLWVGTEGGLARYDPDAEAFIRHVLPLGPQPQPIRAIFEDREGGLWTGVHGRIFRYDASADRFDLYDAFAPPTLELDEAYVSAIQQDAAGNLWILSKNLWELRASLYELDTQAETWRRFEISPEWGQVGPLLIDSRNRLWIKGPEPLQLPLRASPVRPRAGAMSVPHWNFLEDGNGRIWIATAEGVYTSGTDGSGLALHQIIQSPARHNANFVRKIYRTTGGRILLGTTDGLYLSRTIGAPSRVAPAPVALAGVRIAGSEGDRALRPEGLERLELTHADYRVHLEFVAFSLGSSRPARYRFRLHGYDREWVDAGENGSATYVNLPSGRYRFEARAGDSAPLELPLVVKPPFWETWWFRFGVVSSILALLYAAHRFRIHRILEVERMRTRIASDLHDDVTSNLSGIALMSDFVRESASLRPSEERHLDRVAQSARQTAEDLRDIVWFIDPNRDRLEALLLRMKDTASTLLSGTSVVFRVEDEEVIEKMSMEHRRQIFLIYKEILHNIVRHARAEHVEVAVAHASGLLRLHITDDGEGFDPSVAGSGHGLESVRRRAAALGGELVVVSHPGHGTSVTVTARLGRKIRMRNRPDDGGDRPREDRPNG